MQTKWQNTPLPCPCKALAKAGERFFSIEYADSLVTHENHKFNSCVGKRKSELNRLENYHDCDEKANITFFKGTTALHPVYPAT